MPLPFLADVVVKGLPLGLKWWDVTRVIAGIGLIVLIKLYSAGRANRSERTMHSKVIMITGGTTGIGASIAFDLAQRGAQIVLLVRQEPSDLFLVDYIEDLRTKTGNELIYAEQVDLSSTHSIRKFATKWIDNAPPRRLDMIILCASTQTPPGKRRKTTKEGVEETWMVNYLANFHLLSILSPALRNQPADRDVRVIFATCSSYIASPPIITGEEAMTLGDWSPSIAYSRSKLAMVTFGVAFQKHLEAFKRPDGSPNNTRVIFVDPGWTRTPGMRRWLSRGTLWGLGLYLALWHQAWLWLKSSDQGAQSFLYGAMEASLGRGPGGRLIKECMEVDFARKDIKDEEVSKKLWESSEKLIEQVEREEAVKRALAKKEAEVAAPATTPAKVEEASASGTESKKKGSRRSRKAAT